MFQKLDKFKNTVVTDVVLKQIFQIHLLIFRQIEVSIKNYEYY